MATTLEQPNAESIERATRLPSAGIPTVDSPCPTLDRLLLCLMLLCFILMGANMFFDLLSGIWVR
jgi:hypothetical protein